MARARGVLAMLAVRDLEASLALYRDLLGGVEAYRFPPGDDPSFVGLRLGASEIGLGLIDGRPLHGLPQRPASGHRVELCVYVDDVDAAVAEARAAGVPVVREPADQAWGERVAYLSDPDGTLLMLAAPAGPDTA